MRAAATPTKIIISVLVVVMITSIIITNVDRHRLAKETGEMERF